MAKVTLKGVKTKLYGSALKKGDKVSSVLLTNPKLQEVEWLSEAPQCHKLTKILRKVLS